MRRVEDILFTFGMTVFIIAACGYDGQPVICGGISMIGLSLAYFEYWKKVKENEKRVKGF